jgi:putative hemolysin
MFATLRQPVLCLSALLAGLALLLLTLTGCVPTPLPTPQPEAAVANPASVYCQEQGYTVEIRTDQTGAQYGVCVFGPGAECEEWAFYRHECGPLPSGTSTTVTTTQVIKYVPPPPAGEPRQGACFSSSLAVWRADAWRCSADSEIYDPCFGTGDHVTCGADPTIGTPGFTLKLTQALPAPGVPQDTTNHAWLLELADGTVCGFATGATGGVGDKRINYLCRGAVPSQRLSILGDLQPGTVWTADAGVVVAGDQGPTVKETTRVAIRRLWQ